MRDNQNSGDIFSSEDNSQSHDDTSAIIVDVLHRVWLKRWLVLGVAVLIAMIGWAIVGFVVQDEYESKVEVQVDTKSMLRPLLKGIAVDSDFTQQFAYIAQRTLLVRSNLEKVILDADLDIGILDQDEKEALLEKLKDDIEVKGTSKDNIYSISYVHQDPLVAYKIVKGLLDIFVESSLKGRRTDSDSTEKFINRQLVDYEGRLVEAEEKLKAFKRENIGLMPTQSGGYYERLAIAKGKLHESRLQLREMEKRDDALKLLLWQEEEYLSGSVMPNTELRAGPQRIEQLEGELDSLVLGYTELHPRIILLRKTLTTLYAEKNLIVESSSGEPIKQKNPVYQELQISRGQVQSDIAALGVRVAEQKQVVSRLNSLLSTIPGVEAELMQLNRDYRVNKASYEALLERRESAKLSKEAEQSADEVKIKLIEPPRVPILPLGPNRPVLVVGVFVASVGGGLGLIWLLGMMNPILVSVPNLRAVCDFPVYGSVGLVIDNKRQRQKWIKTLCFVLAVGLFFGLFATTLTWQTMGNDAFLALIEV